jgi:exoribonuclease II
MKGARARSWFLTINGTSREDLAAACDFYTKQKKSNIRLFVACEETAPTTGAIHFHAALALANATTRKALTKYFPTANIEPIKGTLRSAVEYVSKEGDFLFRFE